MASYLRDSEIVSEGLPSIRRRGSSPQRHISSLGDEILSNERPHVRFSGTAPSGLYRERVESPVLFGRPSSPFGRPSSPSTTQTQNRKMLMELQDQVKSYKEELLKKDQLISQLSTVDATNSSRGLSQRSIEIAKLETVFGAERMSAETARGEAAALHVKVEHLQAQNKDLQIQVESKDDKIKEIRKEVEKYKENDARLSSLVQSLRDRLHEAESQSGSLEAAAGRCEVTISSLQKENREAQDRIVELESRLRSHLSEREEAEQKAAAAEKKYQEIWTHIGSALGEDGISPASSSSVDILVRKAKDIIAENAIMKGKLTSLHEALENTELETKASRETIMRLVSEVNREQNASSKYTVEMDNLRMERDNAIMSKRELEQEIKLLKERLDASQRAWNATRHELDEREKRLSHLDREARESSFSVRNYQTQYNAFRETLASILSDAFRTVPPSEDSIKDKIGQLLAANKDKESHIELLESKVKNLQEQFQNQYDLQKESEHRAHRLEVERRDIAERLHKYEADLAAGEVFRDGLRTDKENYLKFMEKMAEVMKMDRISSEIGFDMNGETLLTRAEQLVKLEADALADRSTHIYNLQRKIKTMKEQLESKDLHMDLLRKKIVALEEKLVGRSELEKERDGETIRVRKLQKQNEKYQVLLQEARVEITDLKAQLMDSTNLKIKTMEQEKELAGLEKTVSELEKIRHKQAKKIAGLKNDFEATENEFAEKKSSSLNTVQALSSELRTTKQLLEDTSKRERQLVDLRQVISRMLGLDVNTLAIPDYEIISRLEKLIQTHHAHTITAAGLESALEDMEDGFIRGYQDARVVLAATPRRSRSPTRAKTRARSMSPVRRDPRSY
ncbi:coiled-coil domain-containing protein 170 [Lingula anatina]|uniref:Coiled-coil domain-containing protein 170 n=1 Tax=Lingula anatina TaxID=7574 RepID=A0A1S3J8Y0_LINAN|nr:coiled-coil domain-containing protein 170 [Lingula anatina]|eukprot:XP_013406676.1 coiled-coil domain-containing protein 170 [Lingula anatina]